MKCWHCDTELKWYGDEELVDHDMIVTNLDGPNCPSYVEVYYSKEEDRKPA